MSDQIEVGSVGRALRRAQVLLLVALPVVVLFGAFLWQVDAREVVTLLPVIWAVVAGPALAAIVHTQRRLARLAPTAFDPAVLARSGSYAAGALMGFFALGYLGLLLGGPLIVAAGATFALAWVRAEGTDAILVRSIGATLPFLLFIASLTIVERTIVGVVLLAMSASALLRLAMMRHRSSTDAENTAGR